MEIKTWTLNTEAFEANLNDAKLYFLQKMVEEDIITNEQGLKMAEYAISLADKTSNRFGCWLTKLIFKKKLSEKDTNTRFVVVKVFYEKEVEEPVSNIVKEELTDAVKAN